MTGTELLKRIDEIERDNPPIDGLMDVVGLMVEFATTPQSLGQLVERYAGTSSLKISICLVFSISRLQYSPSFDESLYPIICTLLERWKLRDSYPASLNTLLNIIDKEFRKARPQNPDFRPLRQLILDCLATSRDVILWDSIYTSTIDLLNTLAYHDQLAVVIEPTDRPALTEALSRAVEILAEKDADSYSSWIRDGQRVLEQIENFP